MRDAGKAMLESRHRNKLTGDNTMIYCYWISLGLASLHKMHDDGNDVDQAPKKIGKFTTDKAAKDACILHHERACKMARAAGRPEPKLMFM